MLFNNFIIRRSNSPKPLIGVLDKRVNNVIGGILITLAPLSFYKQFFNFIIYQKKDIEYYWKPFASIYEGKKDEVYSNKWYQVKNPITNYSRELISGRLEVIKLHEDSSSERYLLLNNLIAK